MVDNNGTLYKTYQQFYDYYGDYDYTDGVSAIYINLVSATY